jgi:hypothetical protein
MILISVSSVQSVVSLSIREIPIADLAELVGFGEVLDGDNGGHDFFGRRFTGWAWIFLVLFKRKISVDLRLSASNCFFFRPCP